MSDLKYWRRQAEIWENNYHFALKEIERANWLYQELLKHYTDLELEFKEFKQKCGGG